MDLMNRNLKKRILDISYKKNLSHIGSCMSAVDIIDGIYATKKPNDIFILSSGHAGLALYAVLEKYYGYDAEELFDLHGVHPNRDLKHQIYASTGSLGHGLGMGIGMALTDKWRKVHVLISDGEFAEGSIYEGLNLARHLDLKNLIIHINCNGYGAYRRIYSYFITDITQNYQGLQIKIHNTCFGVPFLNGLDAHYYQMKENDHKLVQELFT